MDLTTRKSTALLPIFAWYPENKLARLARQSAVPTTFPRGSIVPVSTGTKNAAAIINEHEFCGLQTGSIARGVAAARRRRRARDVARSGYDAPPGRRSGPQGH